MSGHSSRMKIQRQVTNLRYIFRGSCMQTTVTKRGRTVIPAEIRKRYSIQAGDHLVWLDDGKSIKVIPVPGDPVRALRGRGKGEHLLDRLLEARKKDPELKP